LSWHEVSRPQVHGYDLLGVVSLGPLRFVSVADEKVARVFGAPRNFVKTMRGLGVVDLEVDEVKIYLGLSEQLISFGDAHQTGNSPHERERSAARLVQQGRKRRSAPAFKPEIHHDRSH
jgi:hypothetical protein